MRFAAVAIAVLGSCLTANAQYLKVLDETELVRISERLEAKVIIAVQGFEHTGAFPHGGVLVLTEDAVHFLYDSRRREPIVLPYDRVLARSIVLNGANISVAIATDEDYYIFGLPDESLGRVMAELRVRIVQ